MPWLSPWQKQWPAEAVAVHHNARMLDDPDHALMALIDRVAARDEAALKTLYDLSSGKLYGVALRVTGHREWAEDALQETFLQIWKTAADYRASLSPPMAWLGLIVRSRALDQLRRRKAQRLDRQVPLHRDDDDDGPDLLDQLAAPTAGPDEQLQHSQLAASLQHCLTRLENKQREVVSLAYLRDLSHGEMAAQLAAPLGTVKSWARRGLAQLRDGKVCLRERPWTSTVTPNCWIDWPPPTRWAPCAAVRAAASRRWLASTHRYAPPRCCGKAAWSA